MTRPDTPDPSKIDHQRHAIEDAVKDARDVADAVRRERREVHDQTRQHHRGGGQARAGLDRERDLDDAQLVQERSLADHATAAERRTADEAMAGQAGLLVDAEERLSEARLELDAEAVHLREGLKAVQAELAQIESALDALATGTALQPGLAGIRAATCRVGQLVADLLDPEDATSSHHDIGGSG